MRLKSPKKKWWVVWIFRFANFFGGGVNVNVGESVGRTLIVVKNGRGDVARHMDNVFSQGERVIFQPCFIDD